MSRLFVALRPPPEVTAAISHALEPLLADPHDGLRLTPPNQWHVTLRFIGEADPHEVQRRLSASTLPTCLARLQTTATVMGTVLVFEVRGVELLAAAVQDATPGVGETHDDRRFRGHITLARGRGRSTHRSMRAMLAEVPIELPDGPVSWRTDNVELVSSVTHPSGAVHEVLARYRTV